MAAMGLFRRLTNEDSFARVWVLVMPMVLAVALTEAVGAKLLPSQVLETGAKVCCFFLLHLCSLILGGFVLLSLFLKRKGRRPCLPLL